jgi:OmpA-OmpF porin, OOP family
MNLLDGRPTLPIAACLLAGVLAAAAPTRSDAAPLIGQFYLALDGGVVALQDTTLDYGGAQPNIDVSYDAGWAVSGAAGCRVLDFYRLELEIAYRATDVYSANWGYWADGSTNVTTGMVNGYYDFPIFPYAGLVPFIGVGVGRAQFSQNVQLFNGTLSNSSSHAFAYQAIGGVEFPIIARRLSATLEYRYLSSIRPSFQDVSGFSYKSDYNSHTFTIGLRWGL